MNTVFQDTGGGDGAPVWRLIVWRFLVSLVVLSGLAWLYLTYGPPLKPRVSLLEQVRTEGSLLVITRNGPTSYFLEREEEAGFEYDLVRAFADHLGTETRFLVRESVDEMLTGVANGEGHLAAAALPLSLSLPNSLAHGPPYAEVRQQLVCHREGPKPSSPEETTAGPAIRALAESTYADQLSAWRTRAPGLHFSTVYGPSTEDLMARVARRRLDCAVGDSTLVAMHRRYYPELVVPFDLSGPEDLAWVLPATSQELAEEAARWFALPETRKLVTKLHERYYGHVLSFDYVDLARFERRIETRLPKYQDTFMEAAKASGLPWTLLAAVSYQESHWRARAKSHTGVRGMMMLTQAAARDVGVRNRLDANQSIMGGARYLARLLRRMPEEVEGDDRLWLALAAYNVGFGHVMDARDLARRQGLNPNLWTDVKRTLPLLTQKDYYRTVTYGYARGNEPVRYVQWVRHYQDILERWTGQDA